MSIRYLGLITIAAALGCATTSGTTGARGNSNIITEQEIAAAQVSTAYEVIQKLRPNFLHSRGATSIQTTAPSTPNVYVDGQRYGDTNSLRNISAMNVVGIRYYSVSEGAIKFGMDNASGVIEIRMK
jgi:hypothetical protein